MFRTIEDFTKYASENIRETQQNLNALTDASLGQSVAEGHRTLGRVAWHLIQCITEMPHDAGLAVDRSIADQGVPGSAADIAAAYAREWQKVLDAVAGQWSDADLLVVTDMYGQQWPRGNTLFALVQHETHHCGQLTVLMRQAGLPVHGVFGPAKEEWAQMGAEPPAV